MEYIKIEHRLGMPMSMLVRVDREELEFIANMAFGSRDSSSTEYYNLLAMMEPEKDDDGFTVG